MSDKNKNPFEGMMKELEEAKDPDKVIDAIHEIVVTSMVIGQYSEKVARAIAMHTTAYRMFRSQRPDGNASSSSSSEKQ